MKYYDLIIITTKDIKLNSNLDYLILHDDFIFLNDHEIKVNNEIYEFNYLIYSSCINVLYEQNNLVLLENNVPVTNFFYQTTLEHVYYINKDDVLTCINEILEF